MSAGKGDPIRAWLRAGDRVVIETRQAQGDVLDFARELNVGDRAIDISVQLGARNVEVIGHQQQDAW